MFVIYYLYYRIFKLIKLVSLKSSSYQSRVVFFYSLVTALNVVTLLKVFGWDVLINKYYAIFGALIWYVFWTRFFFNPVRFKNILDRYDRESITVEIIGSMVVFIYIIASFIVFVRIMAN
jgi:hypothetical protein